MKINKITLKNFKSIGNSPLEYNFDTQFNLIKGKSGKGKSLLLAGIVWGLFGKSSDFKGSSNSTLPTSKLINDINKKEMLVTIELDNGYTIKRGLAPSVFEVINEKGISVNDLSAKKLDQDMLEQDILKGLTLDVFYTVNYLCDKPSSVPFLYMTKTQRKDYIEKILDLRIVYHLNENLKPYISTNNLELSKLENQKQLQLDKINGEKENQNDEYSKQLEQIEKREEEIADYYKKITSDETAWKEATDAWNKGDTSILTEMMNTMRDGMSAIMGGDGRGIMGTENLNPEDIKELLGDNMFDVSNIWLDIADQLKELNSINKNLDDLNAKNQTGGTVKNPVFTDSGADRSKPTTSQTNTSPVIPKDPPKPATPSTDSGVKAQHTVVRGDTLWDLAKKYYGNYYQWQKIQKANGNINPYTLPIGKKLIIPFDTGGLMLVHQKNSSNCWKLLRAFQATA